MLVAVVLCGLWWLPEMLTLTVFFLGSVPLYCLGSVSLCLLVVYLTSIWRLTDPHPPERSPLPRLEMRRHRWRTRVAIGLLCFTWLLPGLKYELDLTFHYQNPACQLWMPVVYIGVIVLCVLLGLSFVRSDWACNTRRRSQRSVYSRSRRMVRTDDRRERGSDEMCSGPLSLSADDVSTEKWA